jgi:uncharacterized membrane protein YcaP (DUF421 family)
MLDLSVPWWELVIRSVVVYAFLLVALRLSGKRELGQLAAFDFVLLLILSNAVQNSMNGGDTSLAGGLISAATLVALNFTMGFAVYRSRRIERLIDGQPEVLIHEGKLSERVMARAQLTRQELEAALRREGCASLSECRTAILENNGAISVVQKAQEKGGPDAASRTGSGAR